MDNEQNESLNRYIHEEIMGLCWHEPKFSPAKWGYVLVARCKKCDQSGEWDSLTKSFVRVAYTTSLDAIRPVEEKVILECGREWYGVWLDDVLINDNIRHGSVMQAVSCGAMATAEQRAIACVNAWKEHKENG